VTINLLLLRLSRPAQAVTSLRSGSKPVGRAAALCGLLRWMRFGRFAPFHHPALKRSGSPPLFSSADFPERSTRSPVARHPTFRGEKPEPTAERVERLVRHLRLRSGPA